MQTDELLGWIPKPSIRRGAETRNAKGLRGSRDFDYAKTPGTRRVVVLGDSFTYGLDVADEETYSAQIERAQPNVEVLNFGVNGYGTDQQYLYWSHEASRYRPDVVLLGFFVPDLDRNVLSVREFPKPRFVLEDGALRLVGPPSIPVREYIRQRARHCRSWSRAIDLLAYARRKVCPGESEESFQEKIALAQAILGKLHAEVSGQGAFFAVIVIPHMLYRDYPKHERIERILEETGTDLGFSVINLTEHFEKWQKAHPERPLYGDKEHWNAGGHSLAAEHVVEFLRGHGVL